MTIQRQYELLPDSNIMPTRRTIYRYGYNKLSSDGNIIHTYDKLPSRHTVICAVISIHRMRAEKLVINSFILKTLQVFKCFSKQADVHMGVSGCVV